MSVVVQSRNVTLGGVGAALGGAKTSCIAALNSHAGVVILQLFGAAYSLGLDHRIALVGPVVRQFDRVVAVHKTRADLLPGINAAIAELKASGALAAKQEQWFLKFQTSVPDELVAGVVHFPPYQAIEPGGQFSGFAVEALSELAKRANVHLSFKEISFQECRAGPAAGAYDILVLAGTTGALTRGLDFTLPLESVVFSMFMRNGETSGVERLEDMAGRKVSVFENGLAREYAQTLRGLDLVVAPGAAEQMNALLEGRVDAILMPRAAGLARAERLGVQGRIEAIEPPVFFSDRAPVLRRGFVAIREKLNATIPSFLISDRYKALQSKWFRKAAFWTQTRLYALEEGAVAIILGLIGYVI